MMEWLFQHERIADATAFFRQNGYVGFADLLTGDEIAELRAAADGAAYSGDKLTIINDVIFSIPTFERFVRDKRLWGTAAALIGHPIELYNSKLNAKPLVSETGGEVGWHQDFPFHPHTNYDSLAGIVHIDPEGEDAGPLKVMPGSHKLGPLDHSIDGRFAGKCTVLPRFDAVATLCCEPGTVSFHHCLAVHSSEPKRRAGHRRLLIFGFRSQDALQLAGTVWKSTGLELMAREVGERVRFPDGTTIAVRSDARLTRMGQVRSSTMG